MARRVMANIKPGRLGHASGALSAAKRPTGRKAQALKKVSQILMKFPEKAGQVSATTLSQIDTAADPSGQLNLTVRRALPGALARDAARTNTKRKPVKASTSKYRP